MIQPTLPFDAARLARATDPATSKAAAADCRSLRGRQHAVILEVLATVADATCDEVADRCDLNRHQVGRRMHELLAGGLVRTTGNTRPTPSGRMAQCYEVAK